jgi:hypothetical protein
MTYGKEIRYSSLSQYGGAGFICISIINEKEEEERWNLQLESHRKVRRWWLPPLISFLILAIIGLRRHSVYVGWQLTNKERKPIAETPKD